MTLTTLRLFSTGKTVTYRVQGMGAPLVLIHGVGLQSAAWSPQITQLSASHRVIALDLPGHGGSDPLPDGSLLPDYVAWTRTVLDALDLGPVNVAGHSMGALIAGGLAVTSSHLVHRVALLNGVFKRDRAAQAAIKARAAAIHDGTMDVETPLARWFDDHQDAARAQVAAWLSAVDPESYATAYTAFALGDATYADQFAQITCPLLAITGDGDPNSTPAMAHAMAAMAQNGRAITIQGHRHMVNLTAPAQVNDHLGAWLRTPIHTSTLAQGS